jgi:hypothetical protein
MFTALWYRVPDPESPTLTVIVATVPPENSVFTFNAVRITSVPAPNVPVSGNTGIVFVSAAAAISANVMLILWVNPVLPFSAVLKGNIFI